MCLSVKSSYNCCRKRFVPSPLDLRKAAANGDSTPVTGFILPNFLVRVGL